MAQKKSSSNKASSKTPQKANKASWFSDMIAFGLKWGVVAALWVGMIIAGIILWYAAELPNITKSMVFERRPTVIIKDNTGTIVDRYGDIKGEIVEIKDLPPHVPQAVLAIEDRRFYRHFGMDLKGIGRAFFVNVSEGSFVQGGSTITQQLAKNLFLSRDRKLKRKIQELILSFQLERELTKDEILSAYLNRVYLGSGAYGIDAAAHVYFNKSAKELNIREAATIAGLLKAPSRYAPSNNPELSVQRTSVVLQAMKDAGYITDKELASLKSAPPSPRRKPSSGNSVRYYTDYIVSQLDDLIGTVTEDITVETTLDMSIQKTLEESVTKAILQYGQERHVEQAASIFMRLDGAVVALIGGKNYQGSEFNRATESLRQPGSSFKPIVYLTALENGYNMNSMVNDAPVSFGRYQPQNFGDKYMGMVNLQTALAHSLNTVAVQIMKAVGPEKVIETARRLGITADLEPNLSTALGSASIPMIQMVTAYGTLARGGYAVDPFAIKKITDKEGNVLYEHTNPSEDRKVVEQNDVAQINAMMRNVILYGTGTAASIPYPAAGKTGTSQDHRDAWFIGFTNKYIGAVWFGNDDNSPTKKLTGGSAPAIVWKQVMLTAQTKPVKEYNTFPPVTGEAFNNLLDSILNSSEQDESGWFNNLFNSPNTQAPKNAPPGEFTPRGRHQWQMNE